MISHETVSQCKQRWCQEQRGKQTVYNIGIYWQGIYHLLDNIGYISEPLLDHSETGQLRRVLCLTLVLLGDMYPIGSYCFQLALLSKLQST